jgi:hypothetical protein
MFSKCPSRAIIYKNESNETPYVETMFGDKSALFYRH